MVESVAQPTAFRASTDRSNRSFADTVELYMSGNSTFSTLVVLGKRL